MLIGSVGLQQRSGSSGDLSVIIALTVHPLEQKMYSLIRYFYRRMISKPKRRIVTLGLDGAGKTNLLLALDAKFNPDPANSAVSVPAGIPTLGQNVFAFSFSSITYDWVDVGGLQSFRPSWKHFVKDADAIVFLVDVSTPERWDEAAAELGKLIRDPGMANAPVFVVGNKADLVVCGPGPVTGQTPASNEAIAIQRIANGSASDELAPTVSTAAATSVSSSSEPASAATSTHASTDATSSPDAAAEQKSHLTPEKLRVTLQQLMAADPLPVVGPVLLLPRLSCLNGEGLSDLLHTIDRILKADPVAVRRHHQLPPS